MDICISNFNQIGPNSVTLIWYYKQYTHKIIWLEEILSHAHFSTTTGNVYCINSYVVFVAWESMCR